MKVATPTPDPPVASADAAIIDEAFDRALASWELGQVPSAGSLCPERPDLSAELTHVIELAREIAVVRPKSLAPPRIPGYTTLHELGRGAMGVVYLASQQSLGGRAVALKVLTEHAAGSARARDRFQREANAVARLRHPNIVSVYDIIRDGPDLAMAMELIEGASLQTLIDHFRAPSRSQSHPLTSDDVRSFLGAGVSFLDASPYWAVIARIGVAIARALDTVHRTGLLHRDVKPSNILLRKDGTPLLSDFGLVRDPESPLVSQAGFVGTVAYAPPEQLEATGSEADARCDVYALGATLYHALAFRVPWTGRTPVQVLAQMQSGAPRLGTSARGAGGVATPLPNDLATIVEKAMAPRPADRYQTAAALADDLQRLLDDRPITARRPGTVARSIKWLRRNRHSARGVLLGAAGVSLLTAAAFFTLVTMPRWAAQGREQAWLTLLDPRDTVTIADATFFGTKHNGPPHIHRDLARRALAGYQSALRWQPWDDRIRLEHDAIAAALSVNDNGGSRPVFSDFLRRAAPDACAFFAAWTACPSDAPPPTLPDALASHEELAAIAMMCGVTWEIGPAIECWQRLERLGDPGPFVHAALGLHFLYDQQPGRAYPRLDRAAQTFPDASYIQAALAEAACAEGDLDRAHDLLGRATTLPLSDGLQLERIRVLLAFARGPTDEAIRLFESTYYTQNGRGGNSVLGYQAGRWLAENRRTEQAVRVLARAVGSQPPPRVSRLFLPLAEQWWDALTDEARVQAIVEVIRSVDAAPIPSDGNVLSAYHGALVSMLDRPGDDRAFAAARRHELVRVTTLLSPGLRVRGAAIRGVVDPADQRRWALSILGLGPTFTPPDR